MYFDNDLIAFMIQRFTAYKLNEHKSYHKVVTMKQSKVLRDLQEEL